MHLRFATYDGPNNVGEEGGDPIQIAPDLLRRCCRYSPAEGAL